MTQSDSGNQSDEEVFIKKTQSYDKNIKKTKSSDENIRNWNHSTVSDEESIKGPQWTEELDYFFKQRTQDEEFMNNLVE